MPRPCAVEAHAYQLNSNERDAPRDKPVASRANFLVRASSNERDTPRDKPVASYEPGRNCWRSLKRWILPVAV
jgi:hypothetical protein